MRTAAKADKSGHATSTLRVAGSSLVLGANPCYMGNWFQRGCRIGSRALIGCWLGPPELHGSVHSSWELRYVAITAFRMAKPPKMARLQPSDRLTQLLVRRAGFLRRRCFATWGFLSAGRSPVEIFLLCSLGLETNRLPKFVREGVDLNNPLRTPYFRIFEPNCIGFLVLNTETSRQIRLSRCLVVAFLPGSNRALAKSR